MSYPLEILNEEELKVLYKIFDIKPGEKSELKLQNKLGKIILPVGGLLQSKLSYEDMIDKIAMKNDILLDNGVKVSFKERQLFVALFSTNFHKLDEKGKQEFLRELESNGLSKDQVASIVAITGIGAAQLSGMGVYLLASSAVGAISNALGITLSFATYTAMSSFIKLAIGPVGFVLMAIPLTKIFWKVRSIEDFKDVFKSIFKDGKNLVKGNYEGAEIIFQYLAGLRIMKIHQVETDLQTINNEIVSSLDAKEEMNKKKSEIAVNLDDKDLELKELDLKMTQIKEQRKSLLIEEKELERRLNSTEKSFSENLNNQEQLKSKLEFLNNA